MLKKNQKFNPLKARLRATFNGSDLASFGARLENIDKENEVLHGVQITLEGEALGHGVWLDREFCEAVAAAGNATGDVGLKVRYGHPAMCSDAIGTELGRAKNFRVVDLERTVDGETVKAAGVLADVYILKSAHSAPQGDIAKHVLDMAAEDPKQFGQSIVFTYADWIVKDADGVRHSYNEECRGVDADGNQIVDANGKPKKCKSLEAWEEQSADGKVYAVLGKLHGSDFTDTPAATDGVFSTGTLAEEAEQMLDEHPQLREILLSKPKNVIEFLKRSDLFDALAPEFESARVSGLQAAKDKQIAELQKKLDDATLSTVDYGAVTAELEALKKTDGENVQKIVGLQAELEKLRPECDGLRAGADALAEFLKANGLENLEALSAKFAEQAKALEDANASVKQLSSNLDEAKNSLAAKQAELDAQIQRYRDQFGGALTLPGDKADKLTGRDRAIAALKARNAE